MQSGLSAAGVASSGDIVVQTLRQVREEVIQPVIMWPVVQVVGTRIGAVFASRDANTRFGNASAEADAETDG